MGPWGRGGGKNTNIKYKNEALEGAPNSLHIPYPYFRCMTVVTQYYRNSLLIIMSPNSQFFAIIQNIVAVLSEQPNYQVSKSQVNALLF